MFSAAGIAAGIGVGPRIAGVSASTRRPALRFGRPGPVTDGSGFRLGGLQPRRLGSLGQSWMKSLEIEFRPISPLSSLNSPYRRVLRHLGS